MSLTTIFVDTTPLLDECLEHLSLYEAIAVDLEGINLSREGRISIMQITAEGSSTVWLIDITTLDATAFNHVDANGRSLKGVLESLDIMKAFYDVRSDSDALYNLYGVFMRNVYDIQLLEVACRRSLGFNNVRFLQGLGKSVDTYLRMPSTWGVVKDAGLRLFTPEYGGSYEVFERRPMDPIMIKYCAQDVTILFDLMKELKRKIGGAYRTKDWDQRIKTASSDRTSLAKGTVCQGGVKKDRNRAIAPLI